MAAHDGSHSLSPASVAGLRIYFPLGQPLTSDQYASIGWGGSEANLETTAATLGLCLGSLTLSGCSQFSTHPLQVIQENSPVQGQPLGNWT